MGTFTARRALEDNLKNYLSARKDPVMHNLCLALKEMTKALDDIEGKIEHVSQQVAQVAKRQR
ncbi:MAG: hypothetical protein HC869_17000 [Rhodospirillales bacterium]|nr:hypothetical protein [Rhodospirillales bacterium]